MKKLNATDRAAWTAKTKKLNENRVLGVGASVVDSFGSKGIVVKIVEPEGDPTNENHGTVYVWQSEKIEYGTDNCEHYTFTNWKEMLRVDE